MAILTGFPPSNSISPSTYFPLAKKAGPRKALLLGSGCKEVTKEKEEVEVKSLAIRSIEEWKKRQVR